MGTYLGTGACPGHYGISPQEENLRFALLIATRSFVLLIATLRPARSGVHCLTKPENRQ